jgi:hypothetical protein
MYALAAPIGIPRGIGLVTGVLTWLVLTTRHDLAPPGRQ